MNCSICNAHAIEHLTNRDDFEFKIDTKLDYYKCKNPSCGHVYAVDIPSIDILSTFYKDYTTHRSSKEKNFLERKIYRLRKKTINKLTKAYKRDISILDFGSGNGYYSFLLLELGFKDIQAFDFDEKTKLSFEGSDVKFTTSEKEITSEKYDIILLNHVIEHVPAPRELIKMLYRLLNKKGVLYIRTPNNQSICSVYFKEFWRGWETPRHLNIFNTCSMENLLTNNKDYKISTSNEMFIGIFLSSYNYKFKKNRLLQLILGVLLYLFSLLFSKRKEEIVCVIRK